MNKIKHYRITQAVYDLIERANGKLFLLYTRHNPGDIMSLQLDGNDIGLFCRIEKLHDSFYRYCRVINQSGDNTPA